MGERNFMKRAGEFFLKHERFFEILFVLACFFFYLSWALVKGENYAPDENMRLMIPRFILKHGKLPTGWEGEVLQYNWGISYGFKPTQLPAILSALFMKAASLVHNTDYTLLIAARLTSILAGAGGVFVLFRIMGRLFSRPVKWLIAVTAALIPQYAFLSSYVNNDIVAVFGTLVILWAWVYAAKEGWGAKPSVLLALGIAVVGLSYFNAFGWILMSIPFFFLTQDYPKKTDAPEVRRAKRRKFLKAFLIVFCIAAALLLPLYLRNLILHGDLFGDAATAASQAQRANPDFMASLPKTPKAMGLSVMDMLSYNNWYWPQITLRSFFGYFGFMTYMLTTKYYVVYYFLFAAGLFAAVLAFIEARRRHVPALAEAGIRGRNAAALYLCVLASMLITIGLYTWYAYASDFQAQGRYVYPALGGFLLFMGIGFTHIKRHPRILWFMAFVALVANVLCAYFDVYLQTPPV